MNLPRTFLEVFVPLFIAIDALGLIPMFLALTGGLTPARRHRHHHRLGCGCG